MGQPMLTSEQQKLIELVDQHYNQLADTLPVRFGKMHTDKEDNTRLLKQIEDRPVLHHIIKRHMENGAEYHANEHAISLRLANEITDDSRIERTIALQASYAENYLGNKAAVKAKYNPGKSAGQGLGEGFSF